MFEEKDLIRLPFLSADNLPSQITLKLYGICRLFGKLAVKSGKDSVMSFTDCVVTKKCRGRESNPPIPYIPNGMNGTRDFKSLASAASATPAKKIGKMNFKIFADFSR